MALNQPNLLNFDVFGILTTTQLNVYLDINKLNNLSLEGAMKLIFVSFRLFNYVLSIY